VLLCNGLVAFDGTGEIPDGPSPPHRHGCRSWRLAATPPDPPTTAGGRLVVHLFHLFGALAPFERETISGTDHGRSVGARVTAIPLVVGPRRAGGDALGGWRKASFRAATRHNVMHDCPQRVLKLLLTT